eukprot:scaffold13652_cov193-Alexandrium_tamarense.AAC.4
MSDAYRTQGMSRQIVRILLPRDASSDQLGVQFEPDAQMDKGKNDEMKLVPCDESWQGGIMQLYRAASPTTKDILRQLCPTGATTGVPPKIIEDRTVDESGVDGVGLFYTQSGSGSIEKNTNSGVGFGFFGESVSLPTLSENDMCVFVQPTQEVVDIVESLSTSSMNGSSQQSSPLIALLNPQWRNVDDALDSASKSESVFGAFASFLGGKGSSLRKLEELGYRSTYTLEGYVCKGGNIRLLKRYDSDWLVFAENDNGDKYLKVGTSMERPTYQDVEKMLNDNGVGYKYERDLGLAGNSAIMASRDTRATIDDNATVKTFASPLVYGRTLNRFGAACCDCCVDCCCCIDDSVSEDCKAYSFGETFPSTMAYILSNGKL